MGYINTNITEFLNESNELINFDSFPKDIKKTLFDEYGDFQFNFDWNKKQEEFNDGAKFNEWFRKNTSKEFIKNLDKLIKLTTQDLITLKKKKITEAKLKAFEELIIPTLGNSILTPSLSKYEEEVLMNPNATLKEIEDGFKKSKNIIDDDGSLNISKTKPSKIFKGGEINLPEFERFVEDNPEYKGVFNDWKKLFDEYSELSTKELNAFRNSISIEQVRNLRNFLIDFKKSKNN